MPDVLERALVEAPDGGMALLMRLVLAMVLGAVVAVIYRLTRGADEAVPSFVVTLVLLSILIAMVTQVIGDNVARAFSLVGALSIVRFRTVVRDTQDTAYVIFSVAVGMASGAGHALLAVSGIGVVALAALLMRRGGVRIQGQHVPYRLHIRLGLGHEPAALTPTLDEYLLDRQLISIGTARQGMALELAFRTALRSPDAAGELVRALNRLDGVQSISLERMDSNEEPR